MTRDELQRLIEIIVEELSATTSVGSSRRCPCHAVLDDCCPDRLRGVRDAGATRGGLPAAGGAAAGRPPRRRGRAVGDCVDDRPYAPQARCDAAEYRGAVPRSGAVSLRDR